MNCILGTDELPKFMDGLKPADWKDGKSRSWLDWNGGGYEAKLHDILCKKMHHFAHVCFRARQGQ